MLAMIKQTNACKIVSNNILLYYIYCFKMMLSFRVVAFLVVNIISGIIGSGLVFLGITIGVTTFIVTSALGFFVVFYRERVFAVNSEDGVGGNVFILPITVAIYIQYFFFECFYVKIFSGGFNTLAVLFCLIFAIGLVQAVLACVAAGFGCSVVCCNTNTVEVVVITPSGPMTSIGQIA